MVPLLRRTRKRMKTGVFIVLVCYSLFLLALLWLAGENNLTNQARQFDIFNTRLHEEDPHSRQKKINKDSGMTDDLTAAAFYPEALDRVLQQQPWKLPVRRKLSKPDSQQPNVVVEEAPPCTFAHGEYLKDAAVPFDGPFADLNSSKITDPRSMDWVLAGSPVDSTPEKQRRVNARVGKDGVHSDDKSVQDKEDSGFNDMNPDVKEESAEKAQNLGTWIAPDGVVESQKETETEAPSSHHVRPRPHHKQEPKIPSKVSSPARWTPPRTPPHTSKPVLASSRKRHPMPPNLLSGDSPAAFADLRTPPKPKPAPDSSRRQPPQIPPHAPKPAPVPSRPIYPNPPHIPKPKPVTPRKEHATASSNFSVSREAANFVEIADVVIYSAFYDDRLRVPLVRLLGVGPVSRRSPVVYLWCVFAAASAEPAPVSVHQSGDCKRTRRRYCFYRFHCQIPDRLQKANSSLDSVVIVTSERKDTPSKSQPGERVRINVILNTNAITSHDHDVRSASGSAPNTRHDRDVRSASGSAAVIKTRSSSPAPTFSVCVRPLFGKLTVLQIVEFIELNRLLGASHFVFYTFTVSREVSRLLSFYEEAGVVSAMPWNIPAPNDVWNKGESIAMADCLYRNMHVFDYVVFSDTNEFFVPKQATTWQVFMERVSSEQKKAKTAAYEILPVRIYPNATLINSPSKLVVKSESFKFLTLRNTLRSKALSANFTKLLVKPERVLGIIESQSLVQPISEEFVSQKVDFRSASIYHFTPKVCSQQLNSETGSGTTKNCGDLREDHTIWRHKNALLERTKNVLRTLNRQADSRRT